MADFMDGYVSVAERITKWYELYPDGRIVADPPTLVEIAGNWCVASTARAYRSADDECPCQGSAWEPYPGKTAFVKDSEAQNAETSAVGRALALAGVEVKRSVSSRDEVQNRQAPAIEYASGAARADLRARLKALKLTDAERIALSAFQQANDLPSLNNAQMTAAQLATWADRVDLEEHADA